MAGAQCFYSKPYGFQKVENRKSSSSSLDDLCHRHYEQKSKNENYNYNMCSLLKPNDNLSLYYEDTTLPEFVGEIKIEKSKGKGRGVIAQREILPGELLMVSKALGIVFPESNSSSFSSSLKTSVKRLGSLRESIAELIRQNPSIAFQVYDLYAGPELKYLETPPEENNLIDMERIERICSFNGFQGSVQGYQNDNCYGLWYLPSFINHDCLGSNARWTIFKNFMFVRATKLIPKDTEILISYVDPNDSYSFRRNFFLKHRFQCICAMCELERTEEQNIRRRRDIIMDDFKNEMSLEEFGIERIQSYIEEIESLRPDHPELNVFLIQPLIQLSFVFYEKKNFEDAAQNFIRVYNLCAISSQLSLLCVSCAFTIATCYLRIHGKRDEVIKWINKSKTSVLTHYGTLNVIETIRPTFFKEMTAEGFL